MLAVSLKEIQAGNRMCCANADGLHLVYPGRPVDQTHAAVHCSL
jgi:hypothetical protein